MAHGDDQRCFVIGMATALLVNEHFQGPYHRAPSAIALPWAVPEVSGGGDLRWWIFDSSFGLMNWLLVISGLDLTNQMISWFSTPLGAFTVGLGP